MKKIKYLIISLFVLVAFAGKAYAEVGGTLTYSVDKGTFKKDSFVTVKIVLNTEKAIEAARVGYPDYDTTKLDLVDVTSEMGNVTWKTENEHGDYIVVDRVGTVTGEIKLFTLKFKVLQDFSKDESTTVRMAAGEIANSTPPSWTTNALSIAIVNNDSTATPVSNPTEEDPSSSGSGSSSGSSSSGSSSSSASTEEAKKEEVKSPDTGVSTPILTVGLLSGTLIFIKKNNRNKLYRI